MPSTMPMPRYSSSEGMPKPAGQPDGDQGQQQDQRRDPEGTLGGVQVHRLPSTAHRGRHAQRGENFDGRLGTRWMNVEVLAQGAPSPALLRSTARRRRSRCSPLWVWPRCCGAEGRSDGPVHAGRCLRDRGGGRAGGVVAVRVSVRLGLPSLLLYLGIGMVLGESVLGIEFNDAALTESLGLAALVLILAEGGLTTNWRGGAPCARSRCRALHRVGAGQHRRRRGRAARPAGPGVAHRPAVGRRAVLHRRRRGLQRAARRRGQQAALRRVGAGVRHERRAGRARRPAALLVRADHVAHARSWSCTSWSRAR